MRLGAPRQVGSYTVFLSSGDDAATLRHRVKKLVDEAFNPQFVESKTEFLLVLDMWERAAAQRPDSDQDVNELFVRRARSSDVALVLLLDRLGRGTQEEVEAVLEAGVQLSVLHFTTRTDAELSNLKVGKFIRQHRDKIYYERKRCPPDSEDTWYAIVKTLLAVLLRGVMPPAEEPFVETR